MGGQTGHWDIIFSAVYIMVGIRLVFTLVALAAVAYGSCPKAEKNILDKYFFGRDDVILHMGRSQILECTQTQSAEGVKHSFRWLDLGMRSQCRCSILQKPDGSFEAMEDECWANYSNGDRFVRC